MSLITVDVASLVREDGMNAASVKCPRCPSMFLLPKCGKYECIERSLPAMTVKKASEEDPSKTTENIDERFTQFWAVDDLYKFENMGFSNTVDNSKYLVCADCEVGPVGWHDLVTKISYLSLARVEHRTSTDN